MSAAAVLRSACRALRRGPSFPVVGEQQLFLHRSPAMPREIIPSRRHYSSSDCIVNKLPGDGAKKSKIPADVLVRMSSNFDRAIASSDRLEAMLKQLEENIREDYERRLKASKYIR